MNLHRESRPLVTGSRQRGEALSGSVVLFVTKARDEHMQALSILALGSLLSASEVGFPLSSAHNGC